MQNISKTFVSANISEKLVKVSENISLVQNISTLFWIIGWYIPRTHARVLKDV